MSRTENLSFLAELNTLLAEELKVNTKIEQKQSKLDYYKVILAKIEHNPNGSKTINGILQKTGLTLAQLTELTQSQVARYEFRLDFYKKKKTELTAKIASLKDGYENIDHEKVAQEEAQKAKFAKNVEAVFATFEDFGQKYDNMTDLEKYNLVRDKYLDSIAMLRRFDSSNDLTNQLEESQYTQITKDMLSLGENAQNNPSDTSARRMTNNLIEGVTKIKKNYT
jgi:hypothetical protein